MHSLRFLPGMQLARSAKLERVEQYLARLQALFDVRTLGEHAAAAAARTDLRLREPHFAAP